MLRRCNIFLFLFTDYSKYICTGRNPDSREQEPIEPSVATISGHKYMYVISLMYVSIPFLALRMRHEAGNVLSCNTRVGVSSYRTFSVSYLPD